VAGLRAVVSLRDRRIGRRHASGEANDEPPPLPGIRDLAGFTPVAVLAGMAAAIVPARRASRLNVLDALEYE